MKLLCRYSYSKKYIYLFSAFLQYCNSNSYRLFPSFSIYCTLPPPQQQRKSNAKQIANKASTSLPEGLRLCRGHHGTDEGSKGAKGRYTRVPHAVEWTQWRRLILNKPPRSSKCIPLQYRPRPVQARFPQPSPASAGHSSRKTLCHTSARSMLPSGERWKVTHRRNHYVTLQA